MRSMEGLMNTSIVLFVAGVGCGLVLRFFSGGQEQGEVQTVLIMPSREDRSGGTTGCLASLLIFAALALFLLLSLHITP